jgi:predicted metal-binding protein
MIKLNEDDFMNDKYENEISSEETGWSEAVVMICTKCGKQFSNPEDSESPERIKKDLKSYCKERMGKSVRVINTGCLDVCPENKIAVVVASKKASDVFKAVSVPTNVRADDLYDELF